MRLFRPALTSPAVRRFAAGLVAMVVVAEIGVRVLVAPVLPEPLWHYHGDAQVRVEQLEQLQEEGRSVDVVFTGSSTPRAAFDPVVFGEAHPAVTTAYNAGLSGATPYVVRRFVIEEVVPRVDPMVVVYGITSLDVNRSRGARAVEDTYRAAPAQAGDVWSALRDPLMDHVSLARHRRSLHDLESLVTALKRRALGEPALENSLDEAQEGTGRLGADERYDDDHYEVSATRRAQLADDLLADFSVHPEPLADVQRLADELRARGIALVLVDMPVTDDYVALHPRGDSDYEEYRRAVRRVAAQARVPLVDATGWLDDEQWFADPNHLNQAGSNQLTRRLAEELSRLPAATGPDASDEPLLAR